MPYLDPCSDGCTRSTISQCPPKQAQQRWRRLYFWSINRAVSLVSAAAYRMLHCVACEQTPAQESSSNERVASNSNSNREESRPEQFHIGAERRSGCAGFGKF